jgi:two-component system, OmpR family, sensor histidine kinase BaeS
MPRSLLVRLLAVSLTVAVCAIAATAWLTYRTTSDHLQNEVDRVLETDAAIYQELEDYARQHPTWDEAGTFVSRLSNRTGRRIALTTPGGTLISDSAAPDAGLPSAPAALIDVATGPPDAQLPPVQPAPAPAGEPVQTSSRDLEFNGAFVDVLTSCLNEAGVPHRVGGLAGELRTVQIGDPRDVDAYNDCEGQALGEARERTTADPALLYLGTAAGRFDPVSAAVDGKTIATILVVAALSLGITVAAGLRLLRPVRALTRAARRMESGDTSARVTVKGTDEIAGLANAFNAMADAAERTERARRAMVNDVAHELRNPLANIRGHLEAAQDGILSLDGALVESLLEEAAILERITADLRDLALADAGRLQLHLEDIDLNDIADQVLNASRARANASGVTLAFESSSPAVVLADPTRIRQALGNLLDNALRYTPPGGRVQIVVASDETRASVTVVDTGTGIEPQDLPHLFDRFYRADPSRSRHTGGSGLGLAIAKHLVEAHEGRIDAKSEVGRGSSFTIDLPGYAPSSTDSPVAAARTEAP